MGGSDAVSTTTSHGDGYGGGYGDLPPHTFHAPRPPPVPPKVPKGPPLLAPPPPTAPSWVPAPLPPPPAGGFYIEGSDGIELAMGYGDNYAHFTPAPPPLVPPVIPYAAAAPPPLMPPPAPPPPPPAAPTLPPGWREIVSDKDGGAKFYFNEATGETTWDTPLY
jgi:hypothetical protein